MNEHDGRKQNQDPCLTQSLKDAKKEGYKPRLNVILCGVAA